MRRQSETVLIFGEVPSSLDTCLIRHGARVVRAPSLVPPSADAVLAIAADGERLAEARAALDDLPILALVPNADAAPDAAREGADFVLPHTSPPALVLAVFIAARRHAKLRRAARRSATGHQADLRTALARAAHELNNPLQYILLAVEELELALAGHPELGAVTAELREGVERVREVTRAMVTPVRVAVPDATPGPRPAAGDLATSPGAPARRGRVLVIAGEELLLRTYARCLRRTDVVTACGGRAALEVLARDAAFDVVVCDLTMPDVDGMLVHAWVSEHAPELAPRILFFSDGALTPRMRDFVEHVDNTVIDEPVTVKELRAAVDELMREALTSD